MISSANLSNQPTEAKENQKKQVRSHYIPAEEKMQMLSNTRIIGSQPTR